MKKPITISQYCKQSKGSFQTFIKAKEYPYTVRLGIKIYDDPIPHIKWADLRAALKNHNIDEKLFSDYYGVQTCCSYGPYPHDIEAVFTRIFEKRLTGTQAYWD